MPVANKVIVRPGGWVQALAEIAVAMAVQRGQPAPVGGVAATDGAKRIAASLLSGERGTTASAMPPASIRRRPAARVGAVDRAGERRRARRADRAATRSARTSSARCLEGRAERAPDDRTAAQGRAAVERRARGRHRGSAATGQALAGAAGHRLLAVSQRRDGIRRCDPADHPFTRPSEHSSTAKDGCRARSHRASGSRRPPRLESTAGPGRPARRAGLRFETPEARAGRSAAAGPGRPTVEHRHVEAGGRASNCRRRRAHRRRADLLQAVPILRRSPPLQATRATQPPRARANGRTLEAFKVAAGDKVRARSARPGHCSRSHSTTRCPTRSFAFPPPTRGRPRSVRCPHHHAGARLMDAITAYGTRTLGRGAGRVGARTDRRDRRADPAHGGVPDLLGAQADRLDAHPHRPNRVGPWGLLSRSPTR